MSTKNEIARMGKNGRRSTCTAHGGCVYLSAITTVDLQADISGQAADVFAQIDKLLAASGADKRRILSATVYLTSMADYGPFNAVWDEWVEEGCEPALSVVQAGLPLPEYLLAVSLVAAQR